MTTDYKYVFKIVLVGDCGVGKTSILHRYVDDTFDTSHIATIGVDFKIKTLDLSPDHPAKLQLWDTAGQDRFKSVVASFYRGADCLLVVFDVTDMISFENVTTWLDEARKYGHPDKLRTLALVGNKTDLETQRVVTFDMAQSLADKIGLPYLETSAKSSVNIEQMFETMARAVADDKKASGTLNEINKEENYVTIGSSKTVHCKSFSKIECC